MELVAWIGWPLALAAAWWAWSLHTRLGAVEAERAALVERTRAALGEAEASLRRTREESERARPFAAEPVLRDLLELVDTLDRAVAAGEGAGVEFARRQSLSLLQRHGAERIDAVDQPFDPSHHDAIDTAPGPADRVITEVAAGYRLHGRLLRAARVIVGKDPDQ